MRATCFVLAAGRLQEQPGAPDRLSEHLRSKTGPSWVEVAEAAPEELWDLLVPRGFPAPILDRCMNRIADPGVVSEGGAILTEYPAALEPESDRVAFLSILLRGDLLVTVRHGPIPGLDDLTAGLMAGGAPELSGLPQIIYLILDRFADLNVQAQTRLRDQIQSLAKAVAEKPESVRADGLARLRWQVGGLVALVEDQLYCISGLKASDSSALNDPHRAAYLDDLLSETEIAQRGIYRLEGRVNDLHRDYQVVAGDRVEKRLRVLTIVSAITLPLGLVTGLLGMNVGGLPGTSVWFGFLVVVIIMVAIFVAEFWYFRHKGWFD